jgi:hypothetical protein
MPIQKHWHNFHFALRHLLQMNRYYWSREFQRKATKHGAKGSRGCHKLDKPSLSSALLSPGACGTEADLITRAQQELTTIVWLQCHFSCTKDLGCSFASNGSSCNGVKMQHSANKALKSFDSDSLRKTLGAQLNRKLYKIPFFQWLLTRVYCDLGFYL